MFGLLDCCVSGFSKDFLDGRKLAQSSELTCPVIASEPLSQ